MIESKKLEEQLQKLGFMDYEEMLSKAIVLKRNPKEDPQIENGHILCHFFDELQLDADCSLIVGKTAPDQWIIHSIQTSIQIESNGIPEGVGFLGKKYFQKDGPLPDIDKIKKGIHESVRIHEIKERLAKIELAKRNIGRSLGI
ncbi:hypothetical protein [Pseudoflavitalea rhizosphaerae]|uniref:hypothetical protein n=1 Tax=Pseudoflavitalea rhizosphaerae TaxID=1884793 RepID=UPI000F8E165B|nr:hypothetical protein [Pseudoflavitalea rhizosphaerae]